MNKLGNMNQIDTIIWDLGGVLIDWQPKRLYRKLFRTETAVEYFLNNITTSAWNEEQDAGRPIVEATELLLNQYPEYSHEIKAYYDRWEEEMLGDAVAGSVALLKACIEAEHLRVYALTNWSAETFPVAQEKFEFLSCFEGILVSGAEKMKKPDQAIYELVCKRYQIDPTRAVFIDDSLRNIEGARKFGLKTIHFQSAESIKQGFDRLGIDI